MQWFCIFFFIFSYLTTACWKTCCSKDVLGARYINGSEEPVRNSWEEDPLEALGSMKQVQPQAKENHSRVFLGPQFHFPLSWVLTTRQQQTRCWADPAWRVHLFPPKKTCEQLFPFYGWESRGFHGCHLAEPELCVLLDSRESLSSPQPALLGKELQL